VRAGLDGAHGFREHVKMGLIFFRRTDECEPVVHSRVQGAGGTSNAGQTRKGDRARIGKMDWWMDGIAEKKCAQMGRVE